MVGPDLQAGGCRSRFVVTASPLLEASPSPRVIATIAGVPGSAVAIGFGSVWVADDRGGLVRVDPGTNRVVARIRLGGRASGAAVGYGLVWVASSGRDGNHGIVRAIDPIRNTITGRSIRVPSGVSRIAAGAGSVWVTNGDHARLGRVFRIDPRRRTIVRAIVVRDAPSSITVASGSVWVGAGDTGVVTRLNPSGSVIGVTRVGGALLDVSAGTDAVWVVDAYTHTVSRIDPSSGRRLGWVRRVPGAAFLAVDAGTLWVSAPRRNAVVRLAASTGRFLGRPLRVTGAFALAVDRGALWVTGLLGLTHIGIR